MEWSQWWKSLVMRRQEGLQSVISQCSRGCRVQRFLGKYAIVCNWIKTSSNSSRTEAGPSRHAGKAIQRSLINTFQALLKNFSITLRKGFQSVELTSPPTQSVIFWICSLRSHVYFRTLLKWMIKSILLNIPEWQSHKFNLLFTWITIILWFLLVLLAPG